MSKQPVPNGEVVKLRHWNRCPGPGDPLFGRIFAPVFEIFVERRRIFHWAPGFRASISHAGGQGEYWLERDVMLVIRDLVKIYPGPVTALAGVDLDVPNGMFGLLGPNGAGKTTLMRVLAGLLEPSSGTATLDGESMLEQPQRIGGKLGYLPQDFGFFPHLTGERMLEYLLRLKGVSAPGGIRLLCRELLERVNLSFAARRKVKTYSGGMRQRLGIAQAIAGDPRLIIVDEPTAGLDPEERLRFYRLLSELAADRIVLLSTHIVEDVAVLCPRFAVIRSGRLIAYTTPVEARKAIDGTIHEGTISADSYYGLLADPERCVTQAYLVEGRNRVRVYQPEGEPPEGFVDVAPTLEDAYLVAIKTGRLDGLDRGVTSWPGAAAVAHNGAEPRSAIAERGER
jgi:ABC-2 type transport system ATP-binding protein